MEEQKNIGGILRWPLLYDFFLNIITFGKEEVFRKAILDCANIQAGEKVLDIGCGTGTLAILAKARAGETGSVHGIDAGEEMITRARNKAAKKGLDVKFTVAPAQKLPFNNNTFDIVVSSLVFHHLPDDTRKEAVAEMERVLSPKGRLLIVDFSPSGRILSMLNPANIIHSHSGNKGLISEAEDFLKRAGLINISTGRINNMLGYASGVKK